MDKFTKWHWVKVKEVADPLYKRLIAAKNTKVKLKHTKHPHRKGYIIDTVELRKLRSAHPRNYYLRTIILPCEGFSTVGQAYEYVSKQYKVASERVLAELALQNHRLLKNKVVLAGHPIPDTNNNKILVAWCSNWESLNGFQRNMPTVCDYALHLNRSVQGELHVLIEHGNNR